MIDDKEFGRWWLLLEQTKNGGKKRAGLTQYKHFLDLLMDTEEFQGAAQSVFVTCEFFPTPADFVKARALMAWPEVVDYARAPEAYGEGTDKLRLRHITKARESLPRIADFATPRLGSRKQLLDLITENPSLARKRYAEAAVEACAANAGVIEMRALPEGKRRLTSG